MPNLVLFIVYGRGLIWGLSLFALGTISICAQLLVGTTIICAQMYTHSQKKRLTSSQEIAFLQL